MVLEGEVTKMVIIVVIAIQDNRQVTTVCKVGNATDVQCLLCGLEGHKVTTCRKLPRAQELIKQDKQQYWSKREGYTKRSANNNATKSQ